MSYGSATISGSVFQQPAADQPSWFPIPWRPKPGSVIEGDVAGFATAADHFKPGHRIQLVYVTVDNEVTYAIWVSHSHLRELFTKSFPNLGDHVRVERLRDEKAKWAGGYTKAQYQLTIVEGGA